MDRLDQLRAFVQSRPGDPFPRYALALELKGRGDAAGAAAELERLVTAIPEYLPSYLMLGLLQQQLDRLDDAKSTLRAGQELARRKGDSHALSELTSALESLGAA